MVKIHNSEKNNRNKQWSAGLASVDNGIFFKTGINNNLKHPTDDVGNVRLRRKYANKTVTST